MNCAASGQTELCGIKSDSSPVCFLPTHPQKQQLHRQPPHLPRPHHTAQAADSTIQQITDCLHAPHTHPQKQQLHRQPPHLPRPHHTAQAAASTIQQITDCLHAPHTHPQKQQLHRQPPHLPRPHHSAQAADSYFNKLLTACMHHTPIHKNSSCTGSLLTCLAHITQH